MTEVTNTYQFCQILEGSFSAVSKPIFESEYAFCSMFQALKDVRTLAIWGKLDGVVPYNGTEEYLRIFPNGKLKTLDHGTHDITYRQPSTVGKAILEFIERK